jgi:hypothetical protein
MILFVLKKTSVSLGLNIFSFALIISFGFYAADHHNQIEKLEQHLLFLNRQTIRSQEAATLIKAHEKDFAAFQACKFEEPLNPEMLQKSIFYAIEFGKIFSLDADSSTEGLVSQELSFSVPCLQDRDVFTLLGHLFNEGPGLFQVQEVTIHRLSALSEEMLEKIAAGKHQVLFDGKITAIWIHR